MIKPERLQKGDKVALVSLSSGLAGEKAFQYRAKIGGQRLETDFGLHTVVMPNALKGIAYLDQYPEARADDLMSAFSDNTIKGIFCMIGGDDTIRLLPYIDMTVIRDNPKVFMGYSDTTVNHFMMYKAGLVSFYGPSVMAEFAENTGMHPYTRDHVRAVLFEKNETICIEPSPQWTNELLDWSRPENSNIPRKMVSDEKSYELIQGTGVARGKLLGGCLDVFPMLVGTALWPPKSEWHGKLLFLETSEECPHPNNLKYFLRGLVAQGIIDCINGVIFGKPMGEKYYDEYKQVLATVIGKEAGRFSLPVLYNVNFGHNAPMCVLPYGVTAEIDCNKKTLSLCEAAVQ